MNSEKSRNAKASKQGSKSSKSLEDASPSSSKKKKVIINRNNAADKEDDIKKDRQDFYLTNYMKSIIKKGKQDDTFYCNLCPGKPELLRKNVYRHITDTSKHSLAITKPIDVKGHEELLPLISRLADKNKAVYSNKNVKAENAEGQKTHFEFLALCQSLNLSFLQTSALGKFLQNKVFQNNIDFFQSSSFQRGTLSLMIRAFGRIILDKLRRELIKSPYSITIDSSTIGRKNVTLLKVRYLKDYIDKKGFKRTSIQNRTIGLKYLKHSSTAETMFEITKEKLLNFGEDIKSNLFGFVHDHASNLSGRYDGLGVLLKKELSRYIFDLKDPCHSLNLSLQDSLKKMPDLITDFIDDIHNHVRSPQRVAYLQDIQLDNNFRILAPKRYVKTRWLSLGETIKRLLEIWNSLILYIQAKPKDLGAKETKYSEFLLILQDDFFKKKIQILGCLVDKMNATNIIFQNQSMETNNIKTEE